MGAMHLNTILLHRQFSRRRFCKNIKISKPISPDINGCFSWKNHFS